MICAAAFLDRPEQGGGRCFRKARERVLSRGMPERGSSTGVAKDRERWRSTERVWVFPKDGSIYRKLRRFVRPVPVFCCPSPPVRPSRRCDNGITRGWFNTQMCLCNLPPVICLTDQLGCSQEGTDQERREREWKRVGLYMTTVRHSISHTHTQTDEQPVGPVQ